MRRKVIRQGHNTLTVSLPIKWAKAHNLKEGEEIEVGERGNCLVLSKEAYKEAGEVNVDITGLDRNTIIMLLEGLYTHGYNIINITTKDTKAKWILFDKDWGISQVVNYAVNLMIGAELVSSGKGKYTIEVLTEDSREKFEITLRRIFRLISGLFETYFEGIKKRQKNLVEEIDLQHFNVMKFSNYALRLLNKFGHEDASKTNFYFSLIQFLNKAERIPKNVTGYTAKHLKLSPEALNLMKDIFGGFDMYQEIFYKYDLKKISELTARRDRFRTKFFIDEYKNLSKDDVFILSYFAQIYEIILDLSELRMAMER